MKTSKEVIISCGAYHSPKLLMLSGIGDPAALEHMGIETLHDLPGVGRNLKDHLSFRLKYATRHPEFSFAPGDWKTEWAKDMKTEWETQRRVGRFERTRSLFVLQVKRGLTRPNMECVVSPAILDWKEGDLKRSRNNF